MSAGTGVAVVVVTYNRVELLERVLDGLAAQTRPADLVLVVDNGSTDATPALLDRHPLAGLRTITQANLGGAGGFHRGVAEAMAAGAARIWLIDDDVVPAPDCLAQLLAHDEPCLISVREDLTGALVEKAATRFDLRRPWVIKPKTGMVEDAGSRAALAPLTPVENVAFEGFLVHRDVVARIGLPDPAFFIFYDDVDYALRARRAGYRIRAVRDAVLVRQLDFDQQHDLAGWKGYYMYRNLFVVHRRYGENVLVRLKPWLITLAVLLLAPLRGGRAEARNVVRALRDSAALRELTPAARPGAVVADLS
ncbi:glycosyltransferase [Nocardioides sp.]|uniref:glycosyltransferase n=1 Tax=Nocardioides sp. TaxID=35761 RepID=UPI003515F389